MVAGGSGYGAEINAVAIHECPRGLRVRENVGARTRDVLEPGLGGALERSLHLLTIKRCSIPANCTRAARMHEFLDSFCC
jgi:hypothetical protein